MPYSYQDSNLFPSQSSLLEKVATHKLKDVFQGPYYCLLDIENVVPVIIDDNPQNPSYDCYSVESLLQSKASYENRLKELPVVSDNDPRWLDYAPIRAIILGAIRAIEDAIRNGGRVEFKKFGEFRVRAGYPEVIIYLDSINSAIKNLTEREYVIVETYAHEMFHAWNYVTSHRKGRSFREIEEPMVEFGMLYLLEMFSKSDPSNRTYADLYKDAMERVARKQRGIGSVVAYGFGHYLVRHIVKNKRAEWLRLYSQINDVIPVCFESIRIQQLLSHHYPIYQEQYCKSLFESIVYQKFNSLIPYWNGAKIVGYYYHKGNYSSSSAQSTGSMLLFAAEFAINGEIILHNLSFFSNPNFANNSFIVYYEFDITKSRFSIPAFVTTLESHILSGISTKRFSVPDNIHYLRSCVFSDNKTLESIVFYASLDSIPERTFKNCPRLEAVHFTQPGNKPSYISKKQRSKNPIIIVYESNNTTSIGKDAFDIDIRVLIKGNWRCIPKAFMKGCNNLIHIDYPDSIDAFNESAFEGCQSLSIDIKDTVKTIREHSLSGCKSVKIDLNKLDNATTQLVTRSYSNFFKGSGLIVTLPDGLTQVPANAFASIPRVQLSNKQLPQTISVIGDNAFSMCRELSGTLSLPNVLHIGKNAFRGTHFERINLDGSSLHSLEDGVFSCMSVLETVSLPSGLKTIGDNAFEGSVNLRNINIPTSVYQFGRYAFSCTDIRSLDLEHCGIEAIPEGLCKEIKTLVNVKLPNSITKIGPYAFEKCISLKHINIPTSVKSIGIYAFSETVIDIQSLDLSNNELETISECAFRGCKKLVSVKLPQCTKHIGAKAFENCCILTSINIPTSVVDIGERAFSGTAVSAEYLDLSHNSIDAISERAFSGWGNLVSVCLPYGLKEIGAYAFSNCKGLKTINIPSSVTMIGSGAFAGTIIPSLDLTSNHIEEIPQGAFSGMEELQSIQLPSCLNSIDSAAFSETRIEYIDFSHTSIEEITTDAFCGMKYLQSISWPHHLSRINAQAFIGCPIKNCTLPGSVNEIKREDFRSSAIEDIDFSLTNISTLPDEAFYGCFQLRHITLPQHLCEIGARAFQACHRIESLIIPTTVSVIKNSAFRLLSELREISLENSLVSSIEDELFKDCPKLEKVWLPRTLTRLGNNVFDGCISLKEVWAPGTAKPLFDSIPIFKDAIHYYD